MAERFVVVGIWPDNTARVGESSDPAHLLRKWAHAHGEFLPVAAHYIPEFDEAVYPSTVISIEDAAALGLKIDKAFFGTVGDRMTKLGPALIPLMREWQRAQSANALVTDNAGQLMV